MFLFCHKLANSKLYSKLATTPFGTAFVLDNAAKNKYLYGGKELQDETIGDEQLNLYDFEARFMDTRIPRFTSIDPLAEKYYSVSPYAYVANNPIRFVDPTGMWIVGTDGKKVTYTDGKWSENVSADAQRVGNAMLRTETGTERLSFMLGYDEKISITISSESPSRTNEDTGAKESQLGKNSRINNLTSTGEFLKVGEHQITIYEGSIKDVTNSETGTLPYKGMDLEDAIGAIAGHESGHVERKNSYESFQNEHKEGNNDVEKRPLEIEYKILEELKKNKTKKE